MTEPLEVAGMRLDDADILQNRLGDQRRDAMFLAGILNRIQVVKIDRMNESLVVKRDPGADGNVRVFARRNP